MSCSNGPMSSAQSGCTQPPKRKPLAGSSLGAPGACITPSSDWKTAPVSSRIDGLPTHGRFDRRDVDLFHRHHRLERALGRRLVRVGRRLEENARRDLPREAPSVLAPAARAFLAAVADAGVPIAVVLFLVFGQDHEADRFVGLEDRAAVEADEGPAEERELDSELSV